MKEPSQFFPFLPDFPLFFLIFPSFSHFSPLFPNFGNFFAVGVLCPTLTPDGYATVFLCVYTRAWYPSLNTSGPSGTQMDHSNDVMLSLPFYLSIQINNIGLKVGLLHGWIQFCAFQAFFQRLNLTSEEIYLFMYSNWRLALWVLKRNFRDPSHTIMQVPGTCYITILSVTSSPGTSYSDVWTKYVFQGSCVLKSIWMFHIHNVKVDSKSNKLTWWFRKKIF